MRKIVDIRPVNWYFQDSDGRLTQLVECLLDVQEVRGSSPLSPKDIKNTNEGV